MAENSFASVFKSAPSYLRVRMVLLGSIAFLLAVSTLGLVGWIWKLHRGPKLTEQVLESSRKLASHDVPFQWGYEIKDMSMAVMNKKGTRTAYAQFTIIFDCANEATKRLFEINRAKVINGIFETGSEFSLEDFQAPEAAKGFEQFKAKLKTRMTEYFPKGELLSIVFKDWVMN